MTVVEFFDRVSIDNMVSCFTIRPDKIIFIGDNKPMKNQEQTYRRFLLSKGLNIEFEFIPINRNSLTNICTVLEAIVQNQTDVVFDLTGGEDLVLVAMGMVFNKYKNEKNIQMHRYNINTGNIFDCDNDGKIPESDLPKLTVGENIMLYGGTIVEFDGKKGTQAWVLDDEFINDIETLWNLCKKDPLKWNSQIMSFSLISDFNSDEYDPLKIYVNKKEISETANNTKFKFVWYKPLIKAFVQNGFICNLAEHEDTLSFSFKNSQIKRVFSKSGNILELIVYLYSKQLTDKKGKPIYNDSQTGVFIDWDAELHSSEEKDTENEIDVILMNGLIPIFISCKNSKSVEEIELYKLKTVAEKFGGYYSKKVLITSGFCKSVADAREYFKQRARDMDVILLENVHNLSKEEFLKQLGSLCTKKANDC